MPTELSFFVAGSEYSSSAGASDTMESSEQHLSSSAGSSNSSIDQHSLSSSLTYVDATELQNSEAPTFPSEGGVLMSIMSSLTSSGGEAIELIADIVSSGQMPWAFYVDCEAFLSYVRNRHHRQSQDNEDEEDQGNQNPEGDEGLETNTNGTYRDYRRWSGRPGDVRERMLPRRGAVDYQFARRGEMS